MFFRTKKSGPRSYLQIVENHWRDGRPQQSVIATIGRLDELQANCRRSALAAGARRWCSKNCGKKPAARPSSGIFCVAGISGSPWNERFS